MTRPDDSLLDANQLSNVQRHADRLLQEASAIVRFRTPIHDLMAAVKLTVVDGEAAEGRRSRRKSCRRPTPISRLRRVQSSSPISLTDHGRRGSSSYCNKGDAEARAAA
jgi:hypothetical protein